MVRQNQWLWKQQYSTKDLENNLKEKTQNESYGNKYNNLTDKKIYAKI